MDNQTLEGVGAVYAFILGSGIRTGDQLRTMSDDDCRNTLIVELDGLTHLGAASLQRHSNLELVLIGLGSLVDAQQLGTPASFIRGVLLAGGFRNQRQLNAMSHEDQRNTLIDELTGRTNQANYQSYNDHELAGAGALLVFLRRAGIRGDALVEDSDGRRHAQHDDRGDRQADRPRQEPAGLAKHRPRPGWARGRPVEARESIASLGSAAKHCPLQVSASHDGSAARVPTSPPCRHV